MARIYRITAEMVAGGRRLISPRVSPDGRWIAFVASGSESNRLMVVPAEVGPERQLDVPVEPAGAGAGLAWLPDGSALACLDREGGISLVSTVSTATRRIDLSAIAEAVAAERGLDPDDHDGFAPRALVPSPDGRRAVVTLGDRLVVVVPLGGPDTVSSADPIAESVVLGDSAAFVLDPTWSPDGEVVAWHEWDGDTMPFVRSRILARDPDAAMPGWVVAGGSLGRGDHQVDVAVSQPRFGPDGRLGFLCDAGGVRNLWVSGPGAHGDVHPLLDEDLEHGPPTWGPGDRTWCWGPDGFVAFTRNESGFGRLLLADLRSGWRRELAKGIHTDLEWRSVSFACMRSGARTPDQLESYDTAELLEAFARTPEVDPDALAEQAATGGDAADLDLAAAERLVEGARAVGSFPLTPVPRRRVLARGPLRGFDAAGLHEPEVVRWKSHGGGQVAARLYRPPADTSRFDPPPLLVWVHGGPTDQWQVTFRPKIAYFVERGWAVLVPDHRGSSGHGRDWQDALAGGWGIADVDDTLAGVAAARDRGWCDPDRVVTIGASAGGSTALGVVARPDHGCRAAVALQPVCDPESSRGQTHRWERAYDDWLIGPPGSGRGRFPTDLADRVDVPVLVLHGDADPVVPVEQSATLVAALHARGVHAQYLTYPGAGHSFRGPDLVDAMVRIDDFLETVVIAGA